MGVTTESDARVEDIARPLPSLGYHPRQKCRAEWLGSRTGGGGAGPGWRRSNIVTAPSLTHGR